MQAQDKVIARMFKSNFGKTTSDGFTRLGTICERTVYEGPKGYEEPLYIRSQFNLITETDIYVVKSKTGRFYYIQSPFYDIDEPEEWAEWITEIRQHEREIRENYHG